MMNEGSKRQGGIYKQSAFLFLLSSSFITHHSSFPLILFICLDHRVVDQRADDFRSLPCWVCEVAAHQARLRIEPTGYRAFTAHGAEGVEKRAAGFSGDATLISNQLWNHRVRDDA